MKKQREIELDILRIVALLAVIWVHVGGMQTDVLPTTDRNCQILIFAKSIVSWQIPVYVMISGRFFLDPEREVSVQKIIGAIIRLLIAFAVWNVVYQLFYIWSGEYSGLNWKGILSQALIGPYHFWYIYMIIGLYAITPFLRKIVQEKRLMEYYILLFLVFQFLTKYGTELPLVGSTINEMLQSTNFHFALGYSGYYVLGYYLCKYKVSDKLEPFLYALGIIFVILTGTANTWRAIQEGVSNEWYSGYLATNVTIEAIAIYTFFVKRISKVNFSDMLIKWIAKLSEYSFGVYLVHALVLELIAIVGINPTMASPFFMLPLIVCITFIITNVFVALLRKIPYIGKKIT